MIGHLLRDARYGLQALRRSPGFTAVAVATLALGIGANSAIFSVTSGTLDPLPWKNADRIVSLDEINVQRASDLRGVSPAKYLDWKEQSGSFEALAAIRNWGFNLTDGEDLDFVPGAFVAPEIFALLGVQPVLGRGFTPEEGEPNGARVAILSHGIWERRYGADPGVVGRDITVDGERATVVGVLSATTWVPNPWTEVLLPLRVPRTGLARDEHAWGVLARLRPGVSLDAARNEMDTIASRLAEAYPETDAGWGVRVRLTRDNVGTQGDTRMGLAILTGAVGCVLLIACANVANLLLARGAARQKELAIRASLGASRSRIVTQLLTEGAVLAVLALPLSLLVTRWCLDFVLSRAPDNIHYLDQIFRIDGGVLLFAVAVTSLTTLLFALAPAIQASKPDLNEALKEGGGKGAGEFGRRRLRATLAVSEIALALALLVGAGMLIRSLVNVARTDLGIVADGLLTTALALPGSKYPEDLQWKSFQRDLLGRLEALPEVESAATIGDLPLLLGGWSREFTIEGQAARSGDEKPRALWTNVSSAYFRTVRLPILRGRPFGRDDVEGAAPVAIVNRTLVRRYFGEANPLGERIDFGDGVTREIVGVAGNLAHFLRDDPPARIYEPFEQAPWNYMNVLVRTRGDPLHSAPAFRRELRAIDPEQPALTLRSLRQVLRDNIWSARLMVVLMSALGALALLLASVGVYGVVSYSTGRRTREFGIRAALGAEPRDVAALVLREGLRLSAIGIGIGLLLAAALGRVIASILYEVGEFDAVIFAGTATLLAAVTLGASYVPARRATRVDPMDALRYE